MLTLLVVLVSSSTLNVLGQGPAQKPPAKPRPEFPPLAEVIKDYTKVVSTVDGQEGLFTIWVRPKDGQMLAALPRGYENRRLFIALTVSSGETYAGLQAGDMYVYWKRYDKRLALIEPNITIRSTGDDESRSSVARLFTDRVILDVPIVSMSGGSPVIDMDALLVGQASRFFGPQIRVSNPRLVKIKKAKAFPQNVELAFEVPTARGRLQTLHYSISVIPKGTGYRPRQADTRLGYFTTSFSDYGKFKEPETAVRYINRWNLQKADPSLSVSPPKNPITFYIEHTAPVRYRRWIRQGALSWNEAFEKVGISDAIEVHYQDKRSGKHMDKDPEDVRYNFIRWLNNNEGTAIGPSRVNPTTGQILDADVILTDGWIRHFWQTFHKIMPEIATEGLSPDTMAWLAEHPKWDPRVRLARPAERERVKQLIAEHKTQPCGGHPAAMPTSKLMGDDQFDGLIGRVSQVNGMCTLAQGKAFDVALFRMALALQDCEAEAKTDPNKPCECQAEAETDPNEPCECQAKAKSDPNEPGKDKAEAKADPNTPAKEEVKKKPTPKKKPVPMIDGMPEEFIGLMVADLTCHEIGHTLGLRHNFKGSAVYSLAEINSPEMKGKKAFAGSVMDYNPVNINHEDGEVQGDYAMIGIGPYDEWAIQYGYTQNEKELKGILARVAEPELQYATDEDIWEADPLARRYDFGKDPLNYARSQVRLAKHNRERIIDTLIKDGDSWAKTRKLYEMTLSMQMRSIAMMANWLGGAHIYRDKKGDKNGRLPVEVVSAEKQRDALVFVIENTFKDEAFGLNRDLLVRMSVDKWWDDVSSIIADSTWPVHDMIMDIQATVLANLLYPTTLRRIYDNEFLVPEAEDALTLPELMQTMTDAIWTELAATPSKTYTARKPYVSSLRRNLQREHLELLIDLSRVQWFAAAAYKPIADLVYEQLRAIKLKRINRVLVSAEGDLDPYTLAHLRDAEMQIQKALDAQYVYRQL